MRLNHPGGQTMRTVSTIATAAILLVVAEAQAGGTVVKLGDVQSTAPATWKEKQSPFKTRLNTFVVPKAAGDERDTEIQVIFFGKDSGGGMAENLKRWKGMFQAPDGKTIDDVAKQETFKVGKVSVTTLDIEG